MISRASLASYEDLLEEEPTRYGGKNQCAPTQKKPVKSFNKRKHESEDEKVKTFDDLEDGEVENEADQKKSSEDVIRTLSKLSESLKGTGAKKNSLLPAHKKLKTEKRQEQQIMQQKFKEKKAPFVPRVVCRYFMEGTCSKGERCTFSHNVTPNRTSEEARKSETCKYFIVGSCMKGSSCQFSHDLSAVPCRYHHVWRTCTAGDGCRYSHAPISEEEMKKLRQDVEAKQSSSKQNVSLPTLTPVNPEKEDEVDDPSATAFINPFAAVDF